MVWKYLAGALKQSQRAETMARHALVILLECAVQQTRMQVEHCFADHRDEE